MKKLTRIAAGLAIAVGTFSSQAALAVDRVTAVHAFPSSLIYTKSFLSFVDKVNENGKGVVEIVVRGGPEAIGLAQQPEAVRNGVVDMAYTAASFYAGTVPERDALVASNANAEYARKNGGLDLLNQIHQEKMGVYYLGWFDSGVSYNLYTVNEPKFTDGKIDVTNMRLRSNPVYDAFFKDYLKAQPINLPTTDVYSALERSVANATGWTQIGLKDLGWDKFLKYRVGPDFFSTDMGVIVNLDAWNELSDAAKKVLQDTAIQHEIESSNEFAKLAEEQAAELKAKGMTFVSLPGNGDAEFEKAAKEATWARMREQMEKHPTKLTHYDALIEKFNK
ncbi:TRAP transporter substrate-binding protein DctP [Terasakiella pusilla]|uniref:TRAP transporter substrate-binding protein DctP n=1 Tax=Terasakiella pusilla TaxID=64973 RepID=UPI003AA96B6E